MLVAVLDTIIPVGIIVTPTVTDIEGVKMGHASASKGLVMIL